MDTELLPTSAHLGLILHRLLTDLRLQALGDELDPREVADLTDLMELIPLQFINRDEFYLGVIVGGLRDLARNYPRAVRYAAVLDMPVDELRETLAPSRLTEPLAAAG